VQYSPGWQRELSSVVLQASVGLLVCAASSHASTLQATESGVQKIALPDRQPLGGGPPPQISCPSQKRPLLQRALIGVFTHVLFVSSQLSLVQE